MHGRLMRALAGAPLLSALAIILCATVADPDLWGHLRFGLDMVRDHALAEADPYSYATGGQRWINHEWAAEALLALAWSAAGPLGIILLKALVNGLTTALLAHHLARMRASGVQVAIFLVLLGVPSLLPLFVQARPQVFTFLFFAALLVALRRAEDGDYRWLWAAPPIMALWVNFHGGFLAGLAMLGLWGLLNAHSHWHARWRIFWPTLAAALATLLNPYGAELLFFLLQTATVPRPEIMDWKPLSLSSLLGAGYVIAFVTTLWGLVYTRQPRRPTPLILCAIASLLPWLAVRHGALFAITVIVFAGEHVVSAWQRLVAPPPAAAPTPPAWLAVLCAAGAVVLAAAGATRGAFTQIHIIRYAPHAAIELLRQSGVAGNLEPEFGWGEYALWHLSPRIKVGMDGRRETVYSPLAYGQYLDFRLGRGEWDAVLRRADLALVVRGEPTYNLLKLSPGWKRVIEDDKGALFVKAASPAAAPLERAAAAFTPPPPPKYFP